MKTSSRITLNIVMFALVVFVNYLSNALPLNGVTQRDLSEMYPIYLTPSPYVFSIWGLIYLGLLAYVLIQLLPSQRENSYIRQLDLPFVLSCLFNIGWIFAWHYQYMVLSVALMLGILGSLILAYLRLDSFRAKGGNTEHQWIGNTFSIYLAWICLATILNVSIFLYSMGWRGAPFSEMFWSVVMLGIALVLFLVLALPRKDTSVFGVLAWASFGIQVKHATGGALFTASRIVFVVAMLCAVWCFWSNMTRLSSTKRLLPAAS